MCATIARLPGRRRRRRCSIIRATVAASTRRRIWPAMPGPTAMPASTNYSPATVLSRPVVGRIHGPPLESKTKFDAFGDHGRVQPSIRPCVAALRPRALMIFAAPFPIIGADLASDAPNGFDGAR